MKTWYFNGQYTEKPNIKPGDILDCNNNSEVIISLHDCKIITSYKGYQSVFYLAKNIIGHWTFYWSNRRKL